MNDVKITEFADGSMRTVWGDSDVGRVLAPAEVAALREHFAAEPHTTDARDAVATIRAHSMIREGVCLTANDVDAIVLELDRLAAEQPATPTPSIIDAMVEAAALTTLRRVQHSPQATLDDGPNGDYFRAQARAVLEAALVSPVSPPTPSTEQAFVEGATAMAEQISEDHFGGKAEFKIQFENPYATLVSPVSEQPTTVKRCLDGHPSFVDGCSECPYTFEQPTPLDPEPWVVTGTTTRTAFQRMYGLMTHFEPRPEFEQDRARYPEPTTQPGDSQ